VLGKQCPGCAELLPRSAFHRNAREADGLQSRCKTCRKAYDDERRRRNRARAPSTAPRACRRCGEVKPGGEYARNLSARDGRHSVCKACTRDEALSRKWGNWRALLAAQGGECAICGCELVAGAANVDHCHGTGQIRGVLCKACNVGLGHFKDDPERLERAAKYLNDSRKL